MSDSIETFLKPNLPWSFGNHAEPSSFNGYVNFRKYRVTVELVDEPHEVLTARLQKLWDHCDNYHQWEPLKRAAKEIGYELKGTAGSKLERRRKAP